MLPTMEASTEGSRIKSSLYALAAAAATRLDREEVSLQEAAIDQQFTINAQHVNKHNPCRGVQAGAFHDHVLCPSSVLSADAPRSTWSCSILAW